MSLLNIFHKFQDWQYTTDSWRSQYTVSTSFLLGKHSILTFHHIQPQWDIAVLLLSSRYMDDRWSTHNMFISSIQSIHQYIFRISQIERPIKNKHLFHHLNYCNLLRIIVHLLRASRDICRLDTDWWNWLRHKYILGSQWSLNKAHIFGYQSWRSIHIHIHSHICRWIKSVKAQCIWGSLLVEGLNIIHMNHRITRN